ncbi:hypothetical protein [Paenibacillus hexagrammi]|uniref:Uncharacterized protein n=1 Tax=Paenibacillus hexagrammi TaxID=2908839 RepID=A0ABY3SDE1_9BACL|nr:hypothetical protein [Paenibacillus sp. YPD9-1]UJF31239.1 hypothetical protein L0M14_15285 [Paenibacillus sp. YPD9-1]
MVEDQEIQALKERIIRLETKIDMLTQFNPNKQERPFLLNAIIGFVGTFCTIILIIFLLIILQKL